MTSDEFVRKFRVSRTRIQHGFLLTAVLAAIGLALLLFAGPSLPEGSLVGALNLLFAAGVFAFVFRSARDPRPRMVLDREGIWFRDWGLPVVPWPQVKDARITGSRLLGSVCVELRDPESLLAGLADRARAKIRSNRLVRLPRLLIPDSTLDAPLNEIAEAILKGRAEAGEGGREC